MVKSATTSAARMSQCKGLGPHKHVSRQNSYLHIEQEMVAELGRPVIFGEVFIRAHTKKDGTFVLDLKAQQVVEAFMKNKEAKLSELETQPTTEISDGRHPVLSVEEENEIFIQSTFKNERGELYGIGSLKNQLKGKQMDTESSSSLTQMQKELEEAKRKIEEHVVLIQRQEEENARFAAAQQIQNAELSLIRRCFASEDNFKAFLANDTTSTHPPA